MLRTFVFDLLVADPELNALDYNRDTTYGAIMGADSPQERRFMVLRWGTESPRSPGRDSRIVRTGLTVWVYNRESDYGPIHRALLRIRDILVPIAGVDHGDGWIIDVEDNGTSEDLWDDGYSAITRNAVFTITASDS